MGTGASKKKDEPGSETNMFYIQSTDFCSSVIFINQM
jgi:hypothetical protein